MLKDTDISNGTLYMGRYAGKEIHKTIVNSNHSIKIITPYISSEFVDLLLDKAHQGLDVRLIVSSDIGTERTKYTSLKKLISQTRHTDQEAKTKRDKYLKIIKYSLIAIGLMLLLGIYSNYSGAWYLLAGLPILYFARKRFLNMTIYSYTYESKLSLSVPMSPHTFGFDERHTLTHAKLYILDGKVAYLGSINFTKAAFWKNYESRIKLLQKDVINKLEKEFDYLYDNSNTEYLSISWVGSRIYDEPKN